MVRRLLVLAFVILLGVLSAGVGNAITFGHPDRGRHPNVGALLADYDSDSPGLDVVCTGTLIDEQVFLTAAHCTAFLDSIGIERDKGLDLRPRWHGYGERSRGNTKGCQ